MKNRTILKISHDKIIYFIIVCAAVLRASQFHVTQIDDMDLARHFRMMELVKSSGYSLFEYVFLHGDAFTTNVSMRFCYAFNFIIYITAKHLRNYYVLAWSFIIVDYSIIAYIGVDWWKSQLKRNRKIVLFEMLFCFSLFPFIHAVSGLRTSMSACIMAFAVYGYIYKDKSFKWYVLISVIAATFHPIVILAAVFAVLAQTTSRKKGLIISIGGSFAVPGIANLFIRSSNGFLNSIAFKYLQYTSADAYRGTRFCYYGAIIICILCLMQYANNVYHWNKSKNTLQIIGKERYAVEYKIYDFIAYYMIFIISNVGNYEMVLRPAYLLGGLAPIATGMIFGVANREFNNKGTSKIVRILLLVVMAYVSVMYMIWHSEYFV